MSKIKEEIAQNYLSDARDFRARFDLLWEKELHKTGRIKSFTDLLMAFECALKCHAVLSHRSNNPEEVYLAVRKCGHDISRLCGLAAFFEDTEIYKAVSKELGQFGIEIRYLLNADASFFPLFDGWENAPINYSQTIGNHPWVMELRETLNNLIDPLNEKFGGYVEDTLEEILDHAVEMKEFCRKVGITN
jgi:hypothetical protein